MKAPLTPDSSPKLSMQYRMRRARVYEFTSSQNLIFLSLSGDGDGGRTWHAQAKLLREPSSAPVEGWGESAAAAVEQLAVAWSEQGAALCGFDWEAAGHELRRVRAL